MTWWVTVYQPYSKSVAWAEGWHPSKQAALERAAQLNAQGYNVEVQEFSSSARDPGGKTDGA